MKVSPLAGAVLWALAAVYGVARILQIFPRAPLLLVIVLHVLPPLAFALVHGAITWRLRGILAFCAISFLTGNFFENLSILTGFPFGHYYFTGVMGPKLFLVPVTLGLAYLGIGYLAWTIGFLLVCGPARPLTGRRLVLVPVVAACAMVAWDVAMEPAWSTILRCWIWRDGGAYFGVPLTNFAGWCLTNYVIYQSFAIYLARAPRLPAVLPSTHWRMAVVYYALCAAGNMLVVFAPHPSALVVDPAGVSWSVDAILRASALASLLAMGPFAVLAWPRAIKSKALAAAGPNG